MPPDGSQPENEPVVRPHIVRALRERPKLLGGRLRNEFLGNVEDVLAERRKPDAVASRAARQATEPAREAGERVIRREARDKLTSANEGPLRLL